MFMVTRPVVPNRPETPVPMRPVRSPSRDCTHAAAAATTSSGWGSTPSSASMPASREYSACSDIDHRSRPPVDKNRVARSTSSPVSRKAR